MEGWKFWWGVAAFFLGGLATQLNGWLAYRRQRRDKADDAADALRQRREEFELQHLVEVAQLLRNLLDGMGDAATTARLHARGAISDDEAVARFAASQEATLTAEAALTTQVGFILDDELRALVWAALEVANEVSVDVLEDETAFEALGRASAPMRAAFDAIAARVRELYAGRAGS